jgi:hypothetical protein
VQHFVLPPAMRAPEILGTVVQGLEFTNVDGTRLASDIWEDQVAVLAWFNDHPSSQGVLTELEQFAASAGDGCVLLAVCTEPTTTMSHHDVSDLMQQWSLSLKPVRDLGAVGRDVLGIQRAPTVVVLDRQQRLQLLQEGGDPHLDRQLMELLEKLNQDEDVANSQRMEIDRQWDDYERVLAEASHDQPAS